MNLRKGKILIRSVLTTCYIIMSLSGFCMYAQIPQRVYTGDTNKVIPGNNFINYGMDKITDTYMFLLNGNYASVGPLGELSIFQNYRGIGLRQNTVSFRDDENFNLEYKYPVWSDFKLLARQNLIYSSDRRTGGNNILSRLNASLGANYIPNKNMSFNLSGGYEANRQLSVYSPGLIFDFDGIVQNYNISNFFINSSLLGEHLILDRARTNSDIDFYSSVSSLYENNSRFDINFLYKLMKRDILSGFVPVSDSLPIETRLENRLSPDIRVLFNIMPGLQADLRMNISNLSISKSYKKPDESNQVSKITRTFNELQYGINLETIFNSRHFTQTTGINYYSRTEENKAERKYLIADADLQTIKKQEFLRDNISMRTRIYSASSWIPGRSDTFSLIINLRKFSYDTPSNENYDDRDEVSYNFGVSYMKKFDKSFSGGIFGEVQLLHLVFLKSERSGMNNWNRIFRFGPEFSWKTGAFSINPRLEVLSNYTVYDFENKTGSIRSYSFRQIGYRDTIAVNLGKDISLQSKINLRYFERGILFWDTFSESPQNSNLEYFAKLLLVSDIWPQCSFGLGGRIYSLKQANIAQGTISVNSFTQLSLGPETFLSYRFSDGSNISLQGWYEFQYINNVLRNNIPNLYLFTNIAI